MNYLSVCSGIEAVTVAWHPLGLQPVAYAEIDRFPSAVLAHHYPDVPNFGDLTRFQEWPDATCDVLVGGTPCQSFSIAGLRAGLADPRGNLALTYLALARRYQPRWLVWENVPGVLSADDGRALGAFLGGLAELGYGFAYRVLDAQYFGVAQRRARVFVVGHLGDWRRAAAVLFERASLSGHPAPRREAGEDVAGTLGARTSAGGGLGTNFDLDGGVVSSTGERAHCLNAGGMGRIDYETETLITHALRADGFDASEDGTGRGTPIVPIAFDWQASAGNDKSWRGKGRQHVVRSGDYAGAVSATRVDTVAFDARHRDVIQYGEKSGPLDTNGHTIAVAFQESQSGFRATDAHPTLDSHNGSRRHHGVMAGMQVRRLTPRECERLQGFPDDYTLIPYRGKPAADGPRYKALGNSMAVPVMRWIGERLLLVDALKAGAN